MPVFRLLMEGVSTNPEYNYIKVRVMSVQWRLAILSFEEGSHLCFMYLINGSRSRSKIDAKKG